MLSRQIKRLSLMAFAAVIATLALASVRLSSGSERTLRVEESSRLFGGDSGGSGGQSGYDCESIAACTAGIKCENMAMRDCLGGPPIGNYPAANANTLGCFSGATVEVNCLQGNQVACAKKYYCKWNSTTNVCENVGYQSTIFAPSSCSTYLQVP